MNVIIADGMYQIGSFPALKLMYIGKMPHREGYVMSVPACDPSKAVNIPIEEFMTRAFIWETFLWVVADVDGVMSCKYLDNMCLSDPKWYEALEESLSE